VLRRAQQRAPRLRFENLDRFEPEQRTPFDSPAEPHYAHLLHQTHELHKPTHVVHHRRPQLARHPDLAGVGLHILYTHTARPAHIRDFQDALAHRARTLAREQSLDALQPEPLEQLQSQLLDVGGGWSGRRARRRPRRGAIRRCGAAFNKLD
jgi:hypothetical protein